MPVRIFLPAMLLTGACMLWALRRSKMTTPGQLLVLAGLGAAGVILLVVWR